MFLKHNSLILGLSLACIALPSCVDDKYDLSDVDTTVRVDVNQLTVPVKLDKIKLESILKEGDRIKIIDGNYMVVENGDFTSNAVYIAPVWIKSQLIPMTIVTLPYVPGVISGDNIVMDFTTPESEFVLGAKSLPEEITAIDAIGGDLGFKFTISVGGLTNVARHVEFHDMVIQLPKGLTVTDAAGGSYDSETGELSLPTMAITEECLVFTINATRADFNEMGAVFDGVNHSVDVKGGINIKSGKVAISDFIDPDRATDIKLYISYEVPDFQLTTFSGGLDYKFIGVSFTDIRLDGMPDLLEQPGTNLFVSNPCIFLSVENPMQSYGLYARTGFSITARHNSDLSTYSIDNPYFTIGNDHPDGVYTYCLSPVMPTSVPDGYGNAEHVPYSSLSDVLSNGGNPEVGIPSNLTIKLDNPNIPDQKIVDMPIGKFLKEVRGSYEFRAPIALKEGSTIIYEEIVTGWGSEDFDYITITQLDLDAELTCDIPLALDIEAYPVDKDGKVIDNVRIEGAHINAGSEPQNVHIHITGDVTGFDGIRYIARATAGSGDKELNANMNIIVSNLRPTISGYYMKEL